MKIGLLGDVALFGKNTIKTEGWKHRYACVLPFLRDCDYIIANLETPLTNSNKVIGGKSAYIKGLPEDVEILKYLGVSHVTLANNHMFDYGAQGLEDTIKVLHRAGIQWFGANGKSVEITDQSCNIILYGYCCHSADGKGMNTKAPCINIFDPKQVEEDILQAESKRQLPIISVHWGQEHIHYPNYDHIEVARGLSKNHNIIIHGHHPHVIQGIERRQNSILAYSLGNFCFDDVYTPKAKTPLVEMSRDNKESILITINIERNAIGHMDIISFAFVNNEYTLDEGIGKKVTEWSDFLNLPKREYIIKRQEKLNVFLRQRKALRNFNWYMRRINLESVKIILNDFRNEREYKKKIEQFIRLKSIEIKDKNNHF